MRATVSVASCALSPMGLFLVRSVGPSSTVRSSLLLTMPQDRNIHGKVFGGFLMRQACELAWATGYAFSKEVRMYPSPLIFRNM